MPVNTKRRWSSPTDLHSSQARRPAQQLGTFGDRVWGVTRDPYQMGIGRPLEEGAQVVAVGIGGPAAVPGQKCRRRYSGLVEEGVRDDGGERSWVRIRPRVSPCSIHSSRSCESVQIFSGSTFSPYFPAAISATSCARSFFASRMPTPSSGRWPGCTNVFTTYLPVAALYARNS